METECKKCERLLAELKRTRAQGWDMLGRLQIEQDKYAEAQAKMRDLRRQLRCAGNGVDYKPHIKKRNLEAGLKQADAARARALAAHGFGSAEQLFSALRALDWRLGQPRRATKSPLQTRERWIIEQRFGFETIRKHRGIIADQLGLSEVAVRAAEQKALARLAKAIPEIREQEKQARAKERYRQV